LDESYRLLYVQNSTDEAVGSAELECLDESCRCLFTNEEFDLLLERVKNELLPELSRIVDEWEENYDDPDSDPLHYFDELRSRLQILKELYKEPEYELCFELASENIDSAVDHIQDENADAKESKARREAEERDDWHYHMSHYATNPATLSSSASHERRIGRVQERSIFDDVDC